MILGKEDTEFRRNLYTNRMISISHDTTYIKFNALANRVVFNGTIYSRKYRTVKDDKLEINELKFSSDAFCKLYYSAFTDYISRDLNVDHKAACMIIHQHQSPEYEKYFEKILNKLIQQECKVLLFREQCGFTYGSILCMSIVDTHIEKDIIYIPDKLFIL